MKDLLNVLLRVILAPYRILLQFCSKFKKSSADQENKNQNIPAPSNTNKQSTQPVKKIEADVYFPKIDGGYLRRWEYKENIALSQNLDKLQLNDCDITLVPEPDNQYDANAVALYKGGYKLGYLYKGKTQEMVLSYLNHKNYRIKTVVYLLDNDNNKLAVKIGFYRSLDSLRLDELTVPLTKITKKAEDCGNSRYENVSMAYIGDYVEITENDDGGYTVCDEYGNELGELSASATNKIESLDIIYAKIASIEETDNDSFRVKISIFYR